VPEVPARFLSPRHAAAYLDVSLRTLYAWAADGTIKGVVRINRRNARGIGRHVCTLRIDRLVLDRFLEGRAR
jgi:excisionase family DNA binding protein